ncbi:hypothetical protein KAR91_39140 [Candidatus Pacearchaeota archaeon]|nr:hypothetical protein [Candidatus Pacearchaeota archaeon]
MGHERDLDLLRQIIDTASQIVMAVTPAISETAYDLNAAAFSETTAIADDFILDNVEMNFSSTSIRDITITSSDGTILLEDTDNIDKNFVWSHIEQGFNGGENITIDITQAGEACLVDVKLRIRSGSNTLVGNPAVKWIDTNGTERGFQSADGRPRMSMVPYRHEVAAGNLSGHVRLVGLGERESVQTPVGDIGEDIWKGIATQIPHPPVAGERMTVVSTSAQDGVGGTGIRNIRIEYIDGNGDAQTEDIIMDGLTPVNTSAIDIAFVNHMLATSRGSNGVAVGNINIYKFGDSSTVYTRIMAGGNKDLTTAIRIPDGVTYFLNEWHGSVAGNKPTIIRLRSTDWNGTLYNGDDPVFIFKDTAFIAEGNFDRSLDPPIPIPGGSTIKGSVWAEQAGVFVSMSFNGFYE